MGTGAVNSEVYSVSDARTGSIRVSRLALTGWGAVPTSSAGLFAWSDKGRLWGQFVASSGVLTLYSRPTMLSGDGVCSGTVSAGKVALTALNASGITGTCDVDDGVPGVNPAIDATLDVVVSYADEKALASVLNGAESYLTSATWQGQGVRFEKLLEEAKQKLDAWLIGSFHPRMRVDAYGRYVLAHIVNQGDLKRCHALVAAHMAVLGRGGFVDGAEDRAKTLLDLAREEFRAFAPLLDYERDLSPDARRTPNVVRLWRG